MGGLNLDKLRGFYTTILKYVIGSQQEQPPVKIPANALEYNLSRLIMDMRSGELPERRNVVLLAHKDSKFMKKFTPCEFAGRKGREYLLPKNLDSLDGIVSAEVIRAESFTLKREHGELVAHPIEKPARHYGTVYHKNRQPCIFIYSGR